MPASATTSPTSGYSAASKSTTTRSSPPSEGSSAFGASDASSPLGFLRAAFPHIPVSRLRRALTDVGYTSPSSSQDGEADGSGVEFDLVGVIEGLLTKEYLKDLEERGLDALEDDVPYVAPETMPAKSPGWDVTQQKKKGKKNKGVKLSLNDVRQQHHIRPTISTGASTSRIKPAPDPWTQLSSLSSHLSSLVPSHQPSFFQSFFHKQGVASDSSALATPAMAIRTALSTIAHTDCKVSASSGEGDHDLNPEATVLLFNLTGIIRSNPSFDTLSSSTQSQLFTDALLAIRATNADPGASLDIPWLLCELDQQAEAEWTLSPTTPGYNNGPTSPLVTGKPQHPASALSKSKHLQQLPTRPPSIPDLKQHAATKQGKEAKVVPPVNPWSTIPLKKLPPGPNPLAANIPAYNPLNGVSAKKLRKLAANSAGEPSSAGPAATFGLARIDPKEAQKQKRRMDTMDDLKQKRHDAIVRAGRAWMGGNVKNRGGEVAMFYAEQARELQEQVKKEALGAARDKVEGTRYVLSSSIPFSLLPLYAWGIAIADLIIVHRVGSLRIMGQLWIYTGLLFLRP